MKPNQRLTSENMTISDKFPQTAVNELFEYIKDNNNNSKDNKENSKSNSKQNKDKKYEVDSLTYKIINKDNILKKNKDNDYQFLNILFPKNITRNQKANNYILHYNSKVSYLKK